MRIIARRTLREFWESDPAYVDAISPLTEWYRHMEKVTYATPQDVKAELRTASILKGGRVVFNIAGNKYRVILAIGCCLAEPVIRCYAGMGVEARSRSHTS